MKKLFFQVLAVAVIAFASWAYLRNSIWNNPNLYPDELLMIYARDSSAFFMLLRMFFLAMWGWGVYQVWTSGKVVYAWLAGGIYAAFLLLDCLVLGIHYLQYKAENQPWEAAWPISLFLALPEAILTLFFNAVSVWFLKKSRAKRQQMGDFALNVH